MIIYNGKLRIELDEDIETLNKEIKQLKELKQEIIKSPTYILLDGKTQMLDDQSQQKQEIRSRLQHTKNVASIAKRIIAKIYDMCSIKEISDTELFKLNKQRAGLYTEIIALSHDLGHTPFGHSGEAVLNEFIQSIDNKEYIKRILQVRKECFGEEYEENQGHTEDFDGRLSFEHNEQSAIEFLNIISNSKNDYSKINTKRIINGILSHSITRVPEAPSDLIAQIVRQTDKIEYRNKDYEEIMSYIKFGEDEEDLREYQALSVEQRIRQIIEDISKEAIEKGSIEDDNNALKMCKKLRKKYQNVIYFLTEEGKRSYLTGDNRERQQVIFKKLLTYYYEHQDRIPTKSLSYNNPISNTNSNVRMITFNRLKLKGITPVELAIKYVNSFTNKECMNQYLRLVQERILRGEGYGIEPITEEEIEERKMIQIKEQVDKIRAKDMYKGMEAHTYQEYVKMLQLRNKRFYENDLTDEAKEIIERNRILHQEENEKDKLLWDMLRKADESRKQKSDKNPISPGNQDEEQR